MAIEITCVTRHGLHPSHLEACGGEGWCQDAATVIGQIGEGREYFVRRGEVLLRVGVITENGRPVLSTDLAESSENVLLGMPECG